jgi:amino-acid N-acetyltransferase
MCFPEAGMAELACLAVAPERREGRFGETLLKHGIPGPHPWPESPVRAGPPRQPHWFVERGFAEAQAVASCHWRCQAYNNQRRSKIFVKESVFPDHPRRRHGWKGVMVVTQ